MRVGEVIHVPVALIPDETSPVTNEQAAVWIPQLVLILDIKWKLSCPFR